MTGSAYSFFTSSLPRPCVLPTRVGCTVASSRETFAKGLKQCWTQSVTAVVEQTSPVRGHGICLILTQGSNLALLTTKGALAALPRTCGAVFRGAEAEHGQRLALRGTDKVLRAGRKAEVVAGVPELTFFGTGVRSGRT